MYKSENQLSRTASELMIEENYTNLDFDLNHFNYHDGITFIYPQRWLENPSQNKCVGIRRLEIIPTAHTITFTLTVKNPNTDIETSNNFTYHIMRTNTVHEIINQFINDFNNKFNEYVMYYNLNESNELSLTCYYLDYDNKNYVPAKFNFVYDDNNSQLKELLKFLNQELNDENISKLITLTTEKKFTNVWDREYLEFHASFSDSKRSFIGIKGDFYQKPNVLYNSPTDGSTFTIRFTSDGKHNIFPIHCRFIIQLCFIFNYKKTLAI